MYSTYYQNRPSPLSKLIAWLASPNLLHALGASLLVVATITVAYDFGGIEIHSAGVAHAAPVPVATVATVAAPTAQERWHADESASAEVARKVLIENGALVSCWRGARTVNAPVLAPVRTEISR